MIRRLNPVQWSGLVLIVIGLAGSMWRWWL